ncbi:hypothetical protein [Nostoc sp. PA-18-2419]|uniref:hypothetical protein n=1 Tax=Nostoc sp. PA-18-2419 TaxID=2575443 RepID=UPI0011092324|nr:hypothetical protein [Nostoc sp. PA-18-2419]
MKTLCVKATVAAPVSQVFNDLWQMQQFQNIWQPITQTVIKYDDGTHQECVMWVERAGRQENLRVIRFRCGQDILFFNPEPPPMMSFHQGAWRLFPTSDGGCVIVAERKYELLCHPTETDEEYLGWTEQFHASFQVRLETLLKTFQHHYEQYFSSRAA